MKCHSRNTFILRSHFHHIAFAEGLTPSSAHYVLQYLQHAYVDVLDLVPPKATIVRPTIDTPDEEEVESRVRNIHFLRKKKKTNGKCNAESTMLHLQQIEREKLSQQISCTGPIRFDVYAYALNGCLCISGSFFFQMEKCARNSPRQHKTQKGKNENITSWFMVIEVRYLVPVLNCFGLPFCVSFFLLESSNERRLI